PAMAAAADLSMLRMPAWANGLRTNAAASVPVSAMSSTNEPRPVSSAGSSMRGTLVPTWRAAARAPARSRRRSGMNAGGRLCVPRRQARRIAAGRPAADEAFGQVAAGDVEVAEHAAQLASREQPGDRLAERIEHALLGVVHRAAMGIRADRPDLGAVER